MVGVCRQCAGVVPDSNRGYLSGLCSKRCYNAECNANRAVKACPCCERLFMPKRYEHSCSDECRRTIKKGHKRKYSRIARSMRRAMCKANKIDPVDVFERDHWTCYLCGVQTPAIFKGYAFATSPELEHRVSLANGGTHTMDNVACACYRCNRAKGSMNENEYRLAVSLDRCWVVEKVKVNSF